MIPDKNKIYTPKSPKNQSPVIAPLFLQERQKLPKNSRELHREKFKNDLRNALIRR